MKKITIKAKAPFFQIDFEEIITYRWVFFMLIVRDIKLRYKQTFLGVVWVILQPLLTTVLFSVVFGRLMNSPSDGLPYGVFAFCGLVPWLLFSQALQRASYSIIGDTRLITKVYFPRIYIPLSATFGVVIDFLIALLMLFALMAICGIPLTPQILFLPVCTLVLFIFSSGINLLFAGCNVFYRDFKHILPFLVQLWMYASPLVYSGSMVPEQYRLIYSLNPMAGIIDAFRWSIIGAGKFPLYSFSVACIASLLMLSLGFIIFRKIEHYFADVV